MHQALVVIISQWEKTPKRCLGRAFAKPFARGFRSGPLLNDYWMITEWLLNDCWIITEWLLNDYSRIQEWSFKLRMYRRVGLESSAGLSSINHLLSIYSSSAGPSSISNLWIIYESSAGLSSILLSLSTGGLQCWHRWVWVWVWVRCCVLRYSYCSVLVFVWVSASLLGR